jgi:hypothetical protein
LDVDALRTFDRSDARKIFCLQSPDSHNAHRLADQVRYCERAIRGRATNQAWCAPVHARAGAQAHTPVNTTFNDTHCDGFVGRRRNARSADMARLLMASDG